MSISKIIGLADLVKYALIFVVAVIFIAIFFIGYGVYFIPMVMVAAIIGFLLLSGAWNRAPLWQVMFFIFVTFFSVYAIQRMCVFSLSTVGFTGDTADITGGLLAAFVVGIAVVAAISVFWKEEAGKVSKR